MVNVKIRSMSCRSHQACKLAAINTITHGLEMAMNRCETDSMCLVYSWAGSEDRPT